MSTKEPGTALTLEKAAKRGDMGTSTLRQVLAKGLGPKAYKRPGSNRWTIYADDFDAWLTSNLVSPGTTARELPEDPI